ncbi:MAG: phenylalanine--tRNA ligase subunit beta [Phycisphaerae bacterium]|nr:phenylalanine--tRNA ligase subunit beta [Phycisphaerae bacterium]
MKISLDWLKDYVDITEDAAEIAQKLSDLGFPTESISQVGEDRVIDVEVTSNRGDCLSHIGIARELSAALGRELRLPDVKVPEENRATEEFVKVRIDCPEICRRYTARVITGVKVGPSPAWLRKRLEAVGMRSVNNVVDATNYAMMESGQPPHAFDFGKLSVGTIAVRKAVAGERLVSIDGTKCELRPEMMVIADDRGPVAIAGVMGGLDTEVNDATTTILLEDAHFDPVSVRTTGRQLGIGSEAAFRFERHVDTDRTDWASKRCAQLICEAAGGAVARGVVDCYPAKAEAARVQMRLSRMRALLGIDVPAAEVVRIFTGLGFRPERQGDDAVTCEIPSWRHDVSREADLIEEIARSWGYDKIPVERKIHIEVAAVDKRERVVGRVRTFLGGCGFFETINITFVDEATGALFADDADEHLSVKDESRKGSNLLRRTLLGSLMGVLKVNVNAKNVPCRVYEIADTFVPVGRGVLGELPIQRTRLALVCDADIRELRGVIEGLWAMMVRDVPVEFKPEEVSWAKAGAEIYVGDMIAGTAGIVSEEILKKLDLEGMEICAAELDFGLLVEMAGGLATARPIPRFPAIVRDLSLVVNEHIRWRDIAEAVSETAPAALEAVEFVGIYRGKPIAEGKKSVTASLRFRDEDGTLRHEIVDAFQAAIVSDLANRLGAELRTV